ncbi:UXP [Polar bear adenovirus 1]|uniref:UXP n=1 Tax=Polar bear adenovirus 1 TaxID=2250215 RepID=A0A345S515_9ADEN|nr:UXP [Polar bear adenovirus 1]AXI68668.1 UXP [Polar bear adenovirus 1]
MKLLYNGELLETKVSFSIFRKFAVKNGLKYTSWEQGDWVEVRSQETKQHFQNLLSAFAATFSESPIPSKIFPIPVTSGNSVAAALSHDWERFTSPVSS